LAGSRCCSFDRRGYHEQVRIDQLSEAGLIRLIARTAGRRGRVMVGIGDDACVLATGTVVTTDAYAEGVHFDLSYMTFEQVGARCTCGAVSDIVAMGARPEVLVVALALPGRTDSGAVRSLYRGIERVCKELGCEVGGGDIIALDRLVLVLTAIGSTTRPKLRAGARPGDSIYVTGSLGAAEAGRIVLARPRRAVPGWARKLTERHLYPLPRLEVALTLRPVISSMIDTSDGISTDAAHLAEESRVRIVLDAERLPVLPEVRRVTEAQGLDWRSFVLSAGEDYELLFAGRRSVPAVVNGVPVTRIGRVEKGAGLWLEQAGRINRLPARGYDHLTRQKPIG